MNFKKQLIVFMAFLCLYGCNENITKPEPEPGRRNYVWSVDTVYSVNPIYRIWGSSSTDIWATTIGNLNKSIYHYDGASWSTDGVFRLLSPHSIWGFSSSNVYIGGSGGIIWHYNGTLWQEMATLTKNGYSNIIFDNMWGSSPLDFYAFGASPDSLGLANNSVIAHYNGSWVILDTDCLTGIVERLYRNNADQLIYLQVVKFSNTYDSTFIYSYKQDQYNKIYSTVWSGTWADISLIQDEVYFILKKEVAQRTNNQFQPYLNLENTKFYQRIWGRTSMDIFILMTDGLAHYNGNDIEYLYYFDKPNTQIFEAMLFDKEVFFVQYEYTTNLSLIVHGKLIE
ncbi:MAG: hypothetical protein JXR46_14370 [Calditrichaceae bacterium]|nr:hypothetical protein [Calditrichaceae bacterium]MBN2710224.1 hypothetical protein [Calditrichaceae bacterium]RQV96597.1 MAG: hypothetical protein EH224_04005 [Calditrichota bacterium]